MTPSEVFNQQMFDDFGDGTGHGFNFVDWYWEIEVCIAASAGIPFTDLEKYGDSEDRQCGLCGNVVHTGEGGTPLDCENEPCALAREFWNMRDFRRPLPQSQGGKPDAEARVRAQWFRTQLMNKFGVGQIYKLPADTRLDTALALQLFRMGMEGNKHVELAN